MVAPINSIKHYVHKSNSQIASGANTVITVVSAVVAPATGTAAEVIQGSIIKAVHCEIWVLPDGATDVTDQFNLAIYKAPIGIGAMSVTDMLNMGSYQNKKNILYSSQGVLGPSLDGQGGVPVIRGWVLIPKGKQRFGLEDQFLVTVGSTGTTMRVCGLFTFKEYR